MSATVPAFGIDDVEVVDNTLGYDGFFQIRSLTLRHKLYEGGWSKSINRELFCCFDAVGVLLYDPAMDAVAMVEQFRVGALGHELLAGDSAEGRSPWLLELVAGLIDKAEPPEVVASRESEEEAGALIQQLEPIARYYSSPGGSAEYFHLFCGKSDLSEVGGIHGVEDESEDIRVHVLTVDEALAGLASGRFNNAHSIIALQWLQLNRDRLRSLFAG